MLQVFVVSVACLSCVLPCIPRPCTDRGDTIHVASLLASRAHLQRILNWASENSSFQIKLALQKKKKKFAKQGPECNKKEQCIIKIILMLPNKMLSGIAYHIIMNKRNKISQTFTNRRCTTYK